MSLWLACKVTAAVIAATGAGLSFMGLIKARGMAEQGLMLASAGLMFEVGALVILVAGKALL